MMSSYLFYLLKVSGCFIVFYLVFYFFFIKLTFHKFNRLTLLFVIGLSIIIPLLPAANNANLIKEGLIQLTELAKPEIQTFQPTNDVLIEETPSYLSWTNILSFIYWLGFSIALFKFSISIKKLFSLRKNGNRYRVGNIQIITTDLPDVFSFANWVFIPKDKLNIEAPIIAHEKAHIRFMHSIDLLIVEVYIMMFWFNPFVYFFRKSIRAIHEFQADEAVIKNRVKKSFYLSLLLKQLSSEENRKLLSYFNHPIIQKRVEMITKSESKIENKFRYILLIPVLSFLLLAFTKPAFETKIVNWNVAKKLKSSPDFLFPVPNHTLKNVFASFGITGRNSTTNETKTHGGIDISAVEGSPIIASSEGVVKAVVFKPDWGNLIIISHAGGYETWYAHLKATHVVENQPVAKGEMIGLVGSTGHAKSAHLHFEIRLYGERVNPTELLE